MPIRYQVANEGSNDGSRKVDFRVGAKTIIMANLIEIKPLDIQNSRTTIRENDALGKPSTRKQNPFSFIGDRHTEMISKFIDATNPGDSYEKTRQRVVAIAKESITSDSHFNRIPGIHPTLEDLIPICFPTNPFDWDWNGGGFMFRGNRSINIDSEALPALSSVMKNADEILNTINLTDTNHAKKALEAINSMEAQLIKNGEIGAFDRMASQIALTTLESSILVWNKYFRDDYEGESVFEKTGGPERIAKADLSGAVAGTITGTVGGPAGTVVGGCLGGIGSSWGQFFVELF